MKKIVLFLIYILALFSFADVEVKRFTPIDVFSYLLGVLVLLSVILEPSQFKRFVLLLIQNKWVVVYVLWSFVTALLFWGAYGSPIQFDLIRVIPGIVFYVSVLLYVTKETEIVQIIKMWVLAGLINVTLGFSQYLFGGPHPIKPSDIALEKLDLSGEGADILVTGFFVHPNSFSQVIIPYVVFFTILFAGNISNHKLKAIVYFVFTIIFGLALLATDAKGPILWSIAGIGVGLLIYYFKGARNTLLYWLMWVLMIVAIFLMSIVFVEKLNVTSLKTMYSRIEFMVASFYLFIDHPVKAIIGGGISYWDTYTAEWATWWKFTNAHNVYLNQILMHGMVGTFALIMFVSTVVSKGMNCSCEKSIYLYVCSLIGAIFALTGSYFFEPSFSTSSIKFQLLFLLTLVTCYAQLHRQNKITD